MNGHEIEQTYGVTVIRHSLYLECDRVCACGHDVSRHHGQLSDGYCEECEEYHNFQPTDARYIPLDIYQRFVEPELRRMQNRLKRAEDSAETQQLYGGRR